MNKLIRTKVQRLRDGAQARVLDLFAGCGGLTLGFVRAGCESVGGVEIDPEASLSHATNFHGHVAPALFERHAVAKDITTLAPLDLMRDLGHDKPRMTVDLLVGGPPCPAFTRVGRAKLREVAQHPEAYRFDPRAKLYLPYLRYVQELAPVALLMENVPDILNFGGHNLAEEIAEVLEGLGYNCKYTLLNASNYGVPQMRERFILVAIHEEAGREFQFPQPVCKVDFPSGYEGSRSVALKHLKQDGELFVMKSRYVATPAVPQGAPGPTTARDAIDDLPTILGHLDGSIKRGARRLDQPIPYVGPPTTGYQQLMRNWPGFEGRPDLLDHVIRSHSDRDYRLFRHLQAGDDYPKAHALAVRLFEKELERRSRSSSCPAPGSKEWEVLRAEFVPPYDETKFPNKWRKMEPDEPARTLMAHLGKDGYSHIHYDSRQARVISVREAARLQSFPDGFVFRGTMNPAFRQVGNAVPPILSNFLATAIMEALGIPCSRIPRSYLGHAIAGVREDLPRASVG